MYKMVIADRDREQIDFLKNYTKSMWKEIEIVRIESNGVSLLRYLSKHKIDILVVSVELDGISGLEVARRVRQVDDKLHIVMASEYDYSDFVMEAMNYGVKDYLLKPLKSTEYSAVIARIVEELEDMKQVCAKKNEIERREDRTSIFTEYSFIYTFLWNDKSSQMLKQYREVLNVDKYGYVLNIEFVRFGEECVLDLEKDFTIIYQGIKDAISVSNSCIVGPKMGRRIVVLVCQTQEQAEDPEASMSAIALANMLRFELLRCLDMEVRIGIGSVKKIETIRDSYEEAIKSLRYMDGYDVIHIKDVVSEGVSHKNYMELEAKFLQSAKFGKEECQEQLVQILNLLQPLNVREIKNKLLELMVLVCHEVRIQYENEVNNLDYLSFVGEIQQLNIEELKEWACVKLEYIVKSVRASRSTRKSVVIKEALDYMNCNFKEDLTLEIIANYVGVTPQHFSKVFKEETKVTYVDYLTHIRMDKAKEYLLEGTRTIKEICFAVGFHDPNYFSRKFKKAVGKSPTDFAMLDESAI